MNFSEVSENKKDELPTSPISIVPRDVVLLIFRFLSPEDLCRVCLICRQWNQLASNEALWNAFVLKKIFPRLAIIDKTVWETCADLTKMGLEIKEATLFNKSTFIALKRMFTSLREYMPSGETYDITLLTMPKSLTLKKLKQLIESREHSSDILRIQSDILDEFGDISVEETYRVAMTNEVLDVNTSFSAQNDVDLVIKLGFEVPGLLTATALAVLTYIHRETNFNRTYSPVDGVF